MGNCEPKCILLEQRTNCCVESMFEDDRPVQNLFVHIEEETLEDQAQVDALASKQQFDTIEQEQVLTPNTKFILHNSFNSSTDAMHETLKEINLTV